MLQLAIVFGLLALTVSGEYCHSDVDKFCGKEGRETVENCNTKYSAVENVKSDLQRYTATHIDQNFKYLLMSAYFNNYEANRDGFSKLYRKLADDAWEDALDLIKYMAKRGFNMDYSLSPSKKVAIDSFKMNELASLAKALDMNKHLAEEAHRIHSEVAIHRNEYHDAETINFLESEFVSKHASSIRDLAGHANDLHQLIAGNKDPSLAIYMFDEYLKKTVG